MEFGKIITEKLDKNGKTIKKEENIIEGEVNSPIKRTIEERVRVRTQEEEIEEYRKFSDFVASDPNIINPVFWTETSRIGKQRGYYYIVKSYTKLEYFDNV